MNSRIELGESWRERAGRIILDPNDALGNPLDTPIDRRWLWRIEGLLAVAATNDALRQLAADLSAYLHETCGHHWRHYDGDEDIPAHDQCLWCNEVTFTSEAANKVARSIPGMEQS